MRCTRYLWDVLHETFLNISTISTSKSGSLDLAPRRLTGIMTTIKTHPEALRVSSGTKDGRRNSLSYVLWLFFLRWYRKFTQARSQREKLDGLARLRIRPRAIKFTSTKPRGSGGKAEVVQATLKLGKWDYEQEVAVKKLRYHAGMDKRKFSKVRMRGVLACYQMFTDLFAIIRNSCMK